MTRIGIVAEAPGENRVSATPNTVPKLIALGYDVVVEAGAGAASSFPDAAFAQAGAPSSTERRLGVADRAQGRRADAGRDRPARRRRDDHRDARPGAARPRRGARHARDHGDRARRGAAHLARAVDGRAELDGQHRRLPRGRRGRARVRPLLHRAGDRGGQGAAGEGARRRRRRGGTRRDRRGVEPRCDRACDRPAARGRRPGALDRRRVPRGVEVDEADAARPTATPRRRARRTTGGPPRSTPSRPPTSTSSSRRR